MPVHSPVYTSALPFSCDTLNMCARGLYSPVRSTALATLAQHPCILRYMRVQGYAFSGFKHERRELPTAWYHPMIHVTTLENTAGGNGIDSGLRVACKCWHWDAIVMNGQGMCIGGKLGDNRRTDRTAVLSTCELCRS